MFWMAVSEFLNISYTTIQKFEVFNICFKCFSRSLCYSYTGCIYLINNTVTIITIESSKNFDFL